MINSKFKTNPKLASLINKDIGIKLKDSIKYIKFCFVNKLYFIFSFLLIKLYSSILNNNSTIPVVNMHINGVNILKITNTILNNKLIIPHIKL